MAFAAMNKTRSEWIAELEIWATRLGFAFTFTDNPTTRQTGCSCGPVAAWAACQMKTAGPGMLMAVDLSDAVSYNVRVAGYRHAQVTVEHQQPIIDQHQALHPNSDFLPFLRRRLRELESAEKALVVSQGARRRTHKIQRSWQHMEDLSVNYPRL